ncbi:MAG: hypothetical protein ACKV1O_28010 [Saprospiraceae bacterium]
MKEKATKDSSRQQGIPQPAPACIQAVQLLPGSRARARIQAAIDTVARQGGGCVQLPAGVFIIDSAIDLKSKVHLKGCGRGVTVLKVMNHQTVSASEAWAFKRAVIRIKGCQNARVSDLSLDGNKANNLSYFQFNADHPGGSGQVGIAVCHSFPDKNANNDSVYGHIADRSTWSRDCDIFNCEVFDFVEDGIHILGAENIRVRDCVCNNNSGYKKIKPNELDSSFGILLEQYTENCLIEGCTTFNNHHGGIECYQYTSKRHTIRNCVADLINVNLGFYFDNITGEPDSVFVQNSTNSAVYHTIEGCTIREDFLPSLLRKIENGYALPPLFNLVHGSYVTIRNCTFYCYFTGIEGINRQDNSIHQRDKYNLHGLQLINNRFHLLPSRNVPDLSKPPFHAIHLYCLNDFVISDNVFFWPQDKPAIVLFNCTNGLVSNNLVVGNLDNWTYSQADDHSGIDIVQCESVEAFANKIRGF